MLIPDNTNKTDKTKQSSLNSSSEVSQSSNALHLQLLHPIFIQVPQETPTHQQPYLGPPLCRQLGETFPLLQAAEFRQQFLAQQTWTHPRRSPSCFDTNTVRKMQPIGIQVPAPSNFSPHLSSPSSVARKDAPPWDIGCLTRQGLEDRR